MFKKAPLADAFVMFKVTYNKVVKVQYIQPYLSFKSVFFPHFFIKIAAYSSKTPLDVFYYSKS